MTVRLINNGRYVPPMDYIYEKKRPAKTISRDEEEQFEEEGPIQNVSEGQQDDAEEMALQKVFDAMKDGVKHAAKVQELEKKNEALQQSHRQMEETISRLEKTIEDVRDTTRQDVNQLEGVRDTMREDIQQLQNENKRLREENVRIFESSKERFGHNESAINSLSKKMDKIEKSSKKRKIDE
ncbi:hypothetical protein BGZ63DRAFT_418558 [Mariannaea sp. PMI_226]|nr:hypothetical protein BGZ63DRAFT_418558 [Mariannaea sp. PMI_226]